MAFGLGGLLGGGKTPDVEMPDGLPVSGGKGSPLVDAYLALQAQRLQDAFTAPQRALSGDLPIWDPATGHTTEEAQGAASGMAGLAMTGSMPFKAPAGALRSFGGGESLDDLLGSMSSAIDQHTGSITPDIRPISRVDPKAASWDLYHGTDAPTDFARFETNLPKSQRGHTPDSEAGGVFLSPEPDEAARYSGSIGAKPGAEAGPRVIRTTVNPGRTDVFDLPYLMEHDPTFVARARQTVIDENDGRAAAGQLFDERHARMLDEFQSARDLNKQLAEMGYPATEVPQVQWGYGAAGAAMQMARERGLDTAVLRGLSESNGGDQVVALTPGRVRSYYDPSQVLYSGGPGGALAGLPALASSDPKGSPVSAGPVPGIPSMLDGMSPDMIARLLQAAQVQQPQQAPAGPSPVDSLLFDRSSMGAPDNGFSGTSGTILGDRLPQLARPQVPQPQATGAIPQAAPAPEPQEDGAPAATAPRAMPMPPVRPPELTPPSGGARPASGQPQPMGLGGAPVAAPGAKPEGPGLMQAWKQLADTGIGDQLLAFGSGLLSGGGAAGWSKAGQNMLAVSQASGKNDLERQKLTKEQAALTGNAMILKRAYPNLSDAELAAMATNSGNVTTALRILRDPTFDLPKTPEQMQTEAAATARGSMEGGAKPLERIKGEAQASAEGTAAGKPDDPKLVDVPLGDGTTVKTWVKPGEATGQTVGVPEASSTANEAAKQAQRKQGVLNAGKDPTDPRYADYILSGSLPKETQQLLTASDKKAIMEGEDTILGHKNTLTQLNRALDLSKKAYDGAGASARAMVVSNVPGMLGGHTPESLATRELNNTVTGQALDNLKATFGGAPTEGERAILLQVQGSADMPQALREQIYQNAIAKTQQKLDFEQQRVDQLRGGTYYKQQGGQGGQAQPGSPANAVPNSPIMQLRTADEYSAAPSGTRFIAPDGKLRVKP